MYNNFFKTLLFPLFIAFHAIVRFAEKLAVGNVCFATLTPCTYVVGVHFCKFVYPVTITVLHLRTHRAVACAIGICLLRLPFVECLDVAFLKQTYFEKYGVLLSSEDVFKYTSLSCYTFIGIKFRYSFPNSNLIVRNRMILLI